MTPSDDLATLTSGLRALEVLAHHAPLDVEAFARLSGLRPNQAVALIDVFEVHGFAERMPLEMLYVPTGLAMRVVGSGQTDATLWLH